MSVIDKVVQYGGGFAIISLLIAACVAFFIYWFEIPVGDDSQSVKCPTCKKKREADEGSGYYDATCSGCGHIFR